MGEAFERPVVVAGSSGHYPGRARVTTTPGWAYVGPVTAQIEPVLALLRCPECGASLRADDAASGGEGVTCEAGHRFDLIGGRAPDLAGHHDQHDSPGQQAMRFRPLVKVYESIWRPLFTAVAGGTDPDRETAKLLEWMEVTADATLLDVACGPGNTTRRLGLGVPDGSVVGIDLSTPILEQAVVQTSDDVGIGFARADAHRLPIPDRSVDGVHCAAALYLLADPAAVIAEIRRVLRPGSRFAGMTVVAPLRSFGPAGRVVDQLTARAGVRYFGDDELEAMCDEAGLRNFRTSRRGAALLFSAERPSDERSDLRRR